MKRTLAILLLIFASGVFCIAQSTKSDSTNPDFSGHWVSESVKQFSSVRPSRDGDLNLKIELVVTQSSTELRVKESTEADRESYTRDLIYFLDGRGESNKGFTQGFVYDSKTSLKGREILTDNTITFPPARDSVTQTEEWQLSADRKKLTITTKNTGSSRTSSSNARGTIVYEKIFRLVT
jgi:hypothetical protein